MIHTIFEAIGIAWTIVGVFGLVFIILAGVSKRQYRECVKCSEPFETDSDEWTCPTCQCHYDARQTWREKQSTEAASRTGTPTGRR